jgi:trimethylamine:corrinoid methyltransferase-like protein
MVADAWIWEYAREFARDFEGDGEAISFETVKAVVKGGSYLNQPHTVKNFRRENLGAARPEMGSPARDTIGERGALIRKARKEANRILKGSGEKLVTPEEEKELDTLFKKIRGSQE